MPSGGRARVSLILLRRWPREEPRFFCSNLFERANPHLREEALHRLPAEDGVLGHVELSHEGPWVVMRSGAHIRPSWRWGGNDARGDRNVGASDSMNHAARQHLTVDDPAELVLQPELEVVSDTHLWVGVRRGGREGDGTLGFNLQNQTKLWRGGGELLRSSYKHTPGSPAYAVRTLPFPAPSIEPNIKATPVKVGWGKAGYRRCADQSTPPNPGR